MTAKRRLAIITTHPIQYNAPLFKLMNEGDRSFTIKVFYTWSQSKEEVFDREFGVSRKWDVPLLEGYDYTFVPNDLSKPGSHHFNGIVNPSLNREIEEWKADAVLVFGWSFSSHLKAMRFFYNRIPVLFRGDFTLIDEPAGYSVRKMARRLFLRWIYSRANFALYVGSANKDYFLAHGVKSGQLLFSPHAIDNNRFSGEDADYNERAQNWRAELGIDENDVVFLFAAKFTKKKDPELLIKAFLALDKPGTWLLMVGNGELESELKKTYHSYSKIVFIDFQNQGALCLLFID